MFQPQEFLVEEIMPDGTILEIGKQQSFGKQEDQELQNNYFTHFILQKTEWNTLQALKTISGRVHASSKRFNFAGTKDRNAITTQLCSAFCIAPQRILGVRAKDIVILGAWRATEKVRLGALAGNRFTITLNERNQGKAVSVERIQKNVEESNAFFPNLFGSQRFGSLRENTAVVGEFMVRNDFEGAVRNFLCFTSEKEGAAATAARKQLAQENDFKRALEYFPQSLSYERYMLHHLSQHPTDFVGAMRALPRQLQLLFVHAFQAKLFNELVEERAKQGTLFSPQEGDVLVPRNDLGFPVEEEAQAIAPGAEAGNGFIGRHLIGYESPLFAEERALLEKHGIKQEDFLLKSMPELSPKGTVRCIAAEMKDFLCYEGENGVVVRFSLSSGSYATTAVAYVLR